MLETAKKHEEMTDIELIDHVLLVNIAGGRIDDQCIECVHRPCGGSRGCSAVQDWERFCGG